MHRLPIMITQMITQKEKLVSLIYILGRDHLPLGTIESILKNNIPTVPPLFCNKPLQEYATSVVDRLLSDSVDNSMRQNNNDRTIPGEL